MLCLYDSCFTLVLNKNFMQGIRYNTSYFIMRFSLFEDVIMYTVLTNIINLITWIAACMKIRCTHAIWITLTKVNKCYSHEFVNYNVHLFMIDVRYCGWFHNYGHFYLKLDLYLLNFLAHETKHNWCSINILTI